MCVCVCVCERETERVRENDRQFFISTFVSVFVQMSLNLCVRLPVCCVLQHLQSEWGGAGRVHGFSTHAAYFYLHRRCWESEEAARCMGSQWIDRWIDELEGQCRRDEEEGRRRRRGDDEEQRKWRGNKQIYFSTFYAMKLMSFILQRDEKKTWSER